MEPTSEYKDPVLQKYADTIKGSTGDFYKRIFYGSPDKMAASEMPALILEKADTAFSNMTNVEDLHKMRIMITIVTDVRDTISDDKDMVKGINALYNLMEGRTEDYTLKDTSLLYIIRHNVEIDVGNNLRTDLDTMTQTPYPKGNGSGANLSRFKGKRSIEGTVTLTAHFTQNR